MSILESEVILVLMIEKVEQQSQHLMELLDKAYIESALGDRVENIDVIIDTLTDYAINLSFVVEHSKSNNNVGNCKDSHCWTDAVTSPGIIRDGYSAYISMVEELKHCHYCSSKNIPLRLLSSLANWIVYQKYILGISLKSFVS